MKILLICFTIIALPFIQSALSAEDYLDHLDLAFKAHQGDRNARIELCDRFEKGLISSITLHYIHPEHLFDDFIGESFDHLTSGELFVMGVYKKPLPKGFQEYVGRRTIANDGTACVIRYFLENKEERYLQKAASLNNAQAFFLLGSYEQAYQHGYLGAAVHTKNLDWLKEAALEGRSDAQITLGYSLLKQGDKETAGALFADAFIQGEPLNCEQHTLAKNYLASLEEEILPLEDQAREAQGRISRYLGIDLSSLIQQKVNELPGVR